MTARRLHPTLVLALVAATAFFGLCGILADARAAGTSIGAPDDRFPDGSHEDDSGALSEGEEEIESDDEDGDEERFVGMTGPSVPRLAADPRTCRTPTSSSVVRRRPGTGCVFVRGPPPSP